MSSPLEVARIPSGMYNPIVDIENAGREKKTRAKKMTALPFFRVTHDGLSEGGTTRSPRDEDRVKNLPIQQVLFTTTGVVNLFFQVEEKEKEKRVS